MCCKYILNLRKKPVKCDIESIDHAVLENEHVINTWKFLKFGAGKGLRRSVGPIV